MPQIKDLTGEVFGNIKVLNISEVKVNNSTTWDCECFCGNKFKINTSRLKGKKHCGCLTKENVRINNQKKSKDLINKTIGNLLVIKCTENKNKDSTYLWECKCTCGNIVYVATTRLTNGKTTHCGCKKSENISKALLKNSTKIIRFKKKQHKLSRTSEYNIWTAIKQRCLNSKNISYPNYGGRGIKICNTWLESFDNFIEDMGFKPSSTSSIERIDVNKDYCPENCKWIEKRLQLRNTRRNVLNETIVNEIKNLNMTGLTGAEIYHLLKDKYNLSRSNINGVVYYNRWVNG